MRTSYHHERASDRRHLQVQVTTVLHRARIDAGLTQMELAFLAGITQSVISAYESGRRQPALPMLSALVDAAGFDLVIDVRRQPRRLACLSGPVGRRVRRARRDLAATAAAHGVTNLRVFGSVARGEDRRDSDVDLLADIPPGMSLIGLGQVRADLEAVLGSTVDLVPADSVKDAIRERAMADLVAL